MAKAELGRVPPPLRLCRACRQFVVPGPAACHFCGADLDAAEAEHRRHYDSARKAARRLRRLLEQARRTELAAGRDRTA